MPWRINGYAYRPNRAYAIKVGRFALELGSRIPSRAVAVEAYRVLISDSVLLARVIANSGHLTVEQMSLQRAGKVAAAIERIKAQAELIDASATIHLDMADCPVVLDFKSTEGKSRYYKLPNEAYGLPVPVPYIKAEGEK